MPPAATAALQASDSGLSGPSWLHTYTRLGGSDIVPCALAAVAVPSTASADAAGTAAAAAAAFLRVDRMGFLPVGVGSGEGGGASGKDRQGRPFRKGSWLFMNSQP
ncbi:hypothetical protein GCM10010177_63190 [Actinomadura citrea]|nr:hypothetical protein GCM10010177_63190 [Actinomadura citrea]